MLLHLKKAENKLWADMFGGILIIISVDSYAFRKHIYCILSSIQNKTTIIINTK